MIWFDLMFLIFIGIVFMVVSRNVKTTLAIYVASIITCLIFGIEVYNVIPITLFVKFLIGRYELKFRHKI